MQSHHAALLEQRRLAIRHRRRLRRLQSPTPCRQIQDFRCFTVTTARARNSLRLSRPAVVLGGSDGYLTKHSFLLHDVYFGLLPRVDTLPTPLLPRGAEEKKTFAELKEEENSLLKERIYLKKEIATINANFEAQGAKNESLKKIKLDIGSNYQKNPSSTSVEPQCMVAGQPHQRIVSPTLTRPTQDDTRSQASESRPNEIESTGERFFLIPDLNMTPSDDVSCTDTLC
ncbi:uncharacterized protein [Phaseolus vulgaris]|uniref:uncharacterized protein isoform X3 n=1 Tax=Phaseolus vulgaris TaxID=3885 RepID=UPI0035CBDE64